jgi:DNA-binding beta-propeller fold protein YncE
MEGIAFMKLRKILNVLFVSVVSCSLAMLSFAQEQAAEHTAAPNRTAPLKLVGKYDLPSEVSGKMDQLMVDVPRHLLFATSYGSKSVFVFDLRTHKLVHVMTGFGVPHALLYREDINRLYVTDGGAGEVKIFDGKTYDLIKSVKLLPDTDAIAYDPTTKYIYVVNGGGDAKMTYSTISVIDTTKGDKVGEMKIDGETLDAMEIESSGPKLYVTNVAKTQVEVIDRNTRSVIASWPITLGNHNVAIALDEAHHRLFVGCRTGQIVVFDTETGKQLQALPINQGIDDLAYDPSTKRLYAACPDGAGTVDVYEETDPDHYKSLGQIPTGPGARNGRLATELMRYFVAVPQREGVNADVLEFEVQREK